MDPMTTGEENETHGPGGMDGIDDEPVRAPEDDDAPGGMTGIPEPEDDPKTKRRHSRGSNADART